jgi:hypothetical protein
MHRWPRSNVELLPPGVASSPQFPPRPSQAPLAQIDNLHSPSEPRGAAAPRRLSKLVITEAIDEVAPLARSARAPRAPTRRQFFEVPLKSDDIARASAPPCRAALGKYQFLTLWIIIPASPPARRPCSALIPRPIIAASHEAARHTP